MYLSPRLQFSPKPKNNVLVFFLFCLNFFGVSDKVGCSFDILGACIVIYSMLASLLKHCPDRVVFVVVEVKKSLVDEAVHNSR